MTADLSKLMSMMASVMFVWALFKQWFSEELGDYIHNYFRRLVSYFNPYITIIFHEYHVYEFNRSIVYMAIERYLSANCAKKAKRLKANHVIGDIKSLVLSMDEYEEVTDEFNGITVWWRSGKKIPTHQAYCNEDRKRYYKLTFHRKHQDFITKLYLNHVIDESRAIEEKNRRQKLFTNNKGDMWSPILFEHPSTFGTLAMDPEKKKVILNDLTKFRKSKDYYKKVGKSWKRGYLLYGPPGTGKSSMIAAMANYLEYDIYDLELTSVKDNTDLRKLLINTSSKSIIVIEDIDCSRDLTGQRKKKKEEGEEDEKDLIKEKDEKKKGSEVTLSGLLNFIDGVWSACGSERLIVFTTNHVKNLDPALIRRGRMDMHIELSYCCFETFKVLVKNYLDLESHDLFATIGRLLEDISMTPADVAENLMPKSDENEESVEICLKNLIKSLENAKEEAQLKAEKEQNGENVQGIDKELRGEESSNEEPNDEKPIDEEPSNEGEEPSDEEPSDEDPSDEEPSDEDPSDEDSSDEDPRDEDPSNKEPSDEEPSDEDPSDEEPSEEEPSDEESSEEESSEEESSDEESSD